MDRQQSLDVRRARRSVMGGQRERLVAPGLAELAAMHTASQRDDDQALQLRLRQLELERLRA